MKRGRRCPWRSKSVSEWLWTCCEAHRYSLISRVKKDYRGLAEKIDSVSVRPLTRWLQSEAYDGDGCEVAPESNLRGANPAQQRKERQQCALASGS
jgi:hypothetical protein